MSLRLLLIRYHMWAIRRHARRVEVERLTALGFRDETGTDG